eukprot:799112-Rhodomonas_salina.3
MKRGQTHHKSSDLHHLSDRKTHTVPALSKMHASSSRARNSLLLLVAVCALLCSATLAKPNSAPPKTQAAASPKLQKASILAALRAIT